MKNATEKGGAGGAQPWSIESAEDWSRADTPADGISVRDGLLASDASGERCWASAWHAWPGVVDSAEVVVEAEIDLFDNKTIEAVVEGARTPFTNADGIPHTWYGRCMIAILDHSRWIMALRSGVSHISWGTRDAIHLITSSDEGRSWSPLDRWFDGTPIEGTPYEDGYTHSEPGLYRMPNGDLILQFWRTQYQSGTKQLRSTDDGRTWAVDIDRICVTGVPGADDDMAIGTQDWFVDPENPRDVYMVFEYFHYNGQDGTVLARSQDNGRSYSFVSWVAPLDSERDPEGFAAFEPAIEYVGDRTIVSVLRDGAGSRRTWQSESTDMGASFTPLRDISDQVDGAVPSGVWQRARLYKESNPCFQHNAPLDFAAGEGRLWGFGIHSIGGGYTRKPVVYWSDDNGASWRGPELLHGPMHPGTDTGYGDLKRRTDNTFVGATYYANQYSSVVDVEQYTFGGERARVRIEADCDGSGTPAAASDWHEIYDGRNTFSVCGLAARGWRLNVMLSSTDTSGSPEIRRVTIIPTA